MWLHLQMDEHLEPRPPLPAEATQLELLHAQMASLQARVRKMEEEAAAPSASGIFSLKENSVLSTAATCSFGPPEGGRGARGWGDRGGVL